MKVRRGFKEDPDAAKARHFAAHPEDRDANIVIFKFCDDEEMAGDSQDCTARLGQRARNPKDRGPRRSDAGRVPGTTTGHCYPLSIQGY